MDAEIGAVCGGVCALQRCEVGVEVCANRRGDEMLDDGAEAVDPDSILVKSRQKI